MTSISKLWNTYDEIKYIENSLKRINDPAYPYLTDITYKEFLEKYIATCARRKDWTGMKRNIVLDFATQCLEVING